MRTATMGVSFNVGHFVSTCLQPDAGPSLDTRPGNMARVKMMKLRRTGAAEKKNAHLFVLFWRRQISSPSRQGKKKKDEGAKTGRFLMFRLAPRGKS